LEIHRDSPEPASRSIGVVRSMAIVPTASSECEKILLPIQRVAKICGSAA
jgi:hypothetical protein